MRKSLQPRTYVGRLILSVVALALFCRPGTFCTNALGYQELSIPADWQQHESAGPPVAPDVLGNIEPNSRDFFYQDSPAGEFTDEFASSQPLANHYEPHQQESAEPILQNSQAFTSGQPAWFGYSSPVRVSIHGGDTYAEPTAFVSLDLIKPFRNRKYSNGSEHIQFFDGRVGLNSDGGAVGNIGLGHKHYSAARNAILEYGVWYDIDGTNGKLFNQVSGGAQLQGRLLSFRGHYYFPFGDTTSSLGYTDLTGNTGYVGNTLALERFRIEQQAYQGFEADVGLRLAAALPTEIRAGYYSFKAEDATDISGVSALLAVEASPSLFLSVNGTFDDETGDRGLMFSATYDFYHRGTNNGTSIRRRMSEPVRRNRHILARTTQVNDPVAALNADGTPINIIHVSSAGNSTGAFESPYANLHQATADAAATPNSIILSHADSIFDGQSIVLPEETRFLDETQTHTIATAQLGDVTLPRATDGTAAAIVRNSPAGTPAITLANTSEVNGLRIESAGGVGIFANGLTGGTQLKNTSVDGAETGLLLQNGTGETLLSDLTISNTTQDGIRVENQGGTLTFTNTLVNSAGRHGVHVTEAQGEVTFDALAVDTAGATGFYINENTTGAKVTLTTGATISDTSSHGLHLQANRGTAEFASDGVLAISNTGGHGIHFSANDDTTVTKFNAATFVTNTTGDGLRVSDLETTQNPLGTDITFGNGLTISNTAQSGIVLTNNGSNVGITTLAIENWTQSAIEITNGVGEFHLTNPLVLDNVKASASSTIQIFNMDSTDISFGDVTITDTARTVLGEPTVDISENDTSVFQIVFNTLNVTSANGTALFATQTGSDTTKLEIGGGNLSSVGATVLSLNNVATAVTLQSVSAQDTAIGINLQNVGATTAFHEYLRINGDGGTAGSGGTLTGVQRGIVLNGSDDISLSFLNVNSSVSGIELTADGTDQPERASVIGLQLTDAGGSANWIGIDTAWSDGAHFGDQTIFRDNTITGSGSGQTGVSVVNTRSLTAMDLSINGNQINLSGSNSDGISLSSTGSAPASDSGHINLSGNVNNIINATQNNFISTLGANGAINGTILVNEVPTP